MKRRNVDFTKLRRPPKRTKITDGIYGSAFIYLKLFMIWAFVLMLDFIVDFRFEYLWPLWLLTQSLYDSFKYQGLAFSIFFVCVTITSDVACFFCVPVPWLFFTASTYVWVQYVWQTERGICLPTVILWLLFLYIEVAVRLKEFKNFPFHLDLCRPFAAHCVGYPVITMGFSFKSCISYRFRLIKQKDVQRDNQFYMELLQQALPADALTATDKLRALPSRSQDDISPADAASTPATVSSSVTPPPRHTTSICQTYLSLGRSLLRCLLPADSGASKDSSSSPRPRLRGVSSDAGDDVDSLEQLAEDNGDDDEDDLSDSENNVSTCRSNGGGIISKNNQFRVNDQRQEGGGGEKDSSTGGRKTKFYNISATTVTTGVSTSVHAMGSIAKDAVIPRLEADIKRLKADLQCSRSAEQELKSQISSLAITDRATKNELYQLRQDNESLQTKLHKLVSGKQQDKQSLTLLERRLQDEKKQRTAVELQVAAEKKRKTEDCVAAAARAVSVAANSRSECTLDACKTRRWELENELKQTLRELKLREEHMRLLERDMQSMQQYRESQSPDTDVLMSALGAMQDKNSHLENSLSAETRLKLDLFSALGDAKRQIEIQQALLIQKEVELADLKSKVAEVMAFMPSPPAPTFSPPSSLAMRYSPSFMAAAISQANCYSSPVGCVNQMGVPVNHTGGPPPGLGAISYESTQPCMGLVGYESAQQGLGAIGYEPVQLSVSTGIQDGGHLAMEGSADDVLTASSLNPAASDYTPNITQ